MTKFHVTTLFSSIIFFFFIYLNLAIAYEFIPGQYAEYYLTGLKNPPANNVIKFSLTIGESEVIESVTYNWIKLTGFKQNDQNYSLWLLVDRWPGDSTEQESVRTARYILKEGNESAREYVHALTGKAVIPELRGWDILFSTNISKSDSPFAEHVHYLGHNFKRTKIIKGKSFSLPTTEIIKLRPDMMVSPYHNFRDVEGTRLPLSLPLNIDHKYESYTRKDMEELVESGMNYFWPTKEQYKWCKHWPVFNVYPRKEKNGKYPEMLYRSNMQAGYMFYDEPGFRGRNKIKAEYTPAEAGSTIVKFTREDFERNNTALQQILIDRNDIDLGDLDLRHDLPGWETPVSTAWYQMSGGVTGTIQEARYRLYMQLPLLNAQYGCEIPLYPEYLMRFYFAQLRGAARHFECDWGIAVYGRCEQRLAPQVFKLAYDMGARYFWFWTNCEFSCITYPEQVNLARIIKSHAARHPYRDMQALLHAAKVAIVLPDGYSFEYSGLMYCLPTHHMERINEYGVTYRSVLHNAAVEMERLLRLGIEFDIVVDRDNFSGGGYDELIYIKEDATLSIVKNGKEEKQTVPRNPPRPHLQEKPRIKASIYEFYMGGEAPYQLRIYGTAAGGCEPLGFDYEFHWPMAPLQRRVPVIWEHFLPSGEYKVIYNSRQILDLNEPGKHIFRAFTVDAYGSTADKWFSVTFDEKGQIRKKITEGK